MATNPMAANPMPALLSRHDGHQQKDKGYFNRNDEIAWSVYWVVVAFVTMTLGTRRLLIWHLGHQRQRACSYETIERHHSKITRYTTSSTFLATLRWLLYPRYTGFQGTSSLSRGELLFSGTYLVFTWALLLTHVFFSSSSPLYTIEWEVLGFRAAWIATAQLPLLYCTSGRIEPLKTITGVAEDKVKRFHALIGINILSILTIHWASFLHVWDITHTIMYTFQQRPMVIWGFAAWSIFASTILLSLTSLRSRWHEPWLISHVILGFAGLLLSYVHTRCTTYFVIASLGLIILNKMGKLYFLLACNLHLSLRRPSGVLLWGYEARLELLDHQYLQLCIKSPSFAWKPGQHIYVYAPQIRLFETHPFTIANSVCSSKSDRHLSIIIKKQDGFTRSLFDSLSRTDMLPLHISLLGPFGNVPQFEDQNTAIFIASGNRTSYIIPLIEDLCSTPRQVRQIIAHLIFPSTDCKDWYRSQFKNCHFLAQQHDIDLKFHVHITGTSRLLTPQSSPNQSSQVETFVIGRDSMEVSSTDSEDIENICDSESSTLLASKSDKDTISASPIDAPNDFHSLAVGDEKSSALRMNSADSSQDDFFPESRLIKKESAQNFTAGNRDHDYESMLQLHYGRPTAQKMIYLSVAGPMSERRIIVVAAVGASLRGSVSNSVSAVCKDIVMLRKTIAGNRNLPQSISLWSESNGA